MTRADIVRLARARIGTPFAHQGRTEFAMDCRGLILCVALAAGLPEGIAAANDERVKAYARTPDGRTVTEMCRKYLDLLESPEMAVCGDVLVFRFATDPQHFGIISSLKPWRIIHAYESAGKVCENGIDGKWRNKTWRSLIVSAWRFRGVE